MNLLLHFFVLVTWALWFGGVMGLFVFVTSLFRAGLGPDAAPVLFHAFERSQMIVATVGLAATWLWWMAGRSRWKMSLFVLLALAGGMAAISTTRITPRIDAMRLQKQTKSDEFRRLHGRSMMLYSAQATLLLLGGGALAMESRRRDVMPRS